MRLKDDARDSVRSMARNREGPLNQHQRFMDIVLKHKGPEAIRDVKEAKRFFQGLLEHSDDPKTMLMMLGASKHSRPVLHQVLSLDIPGDLFVQVLEVLGRDELGIGKVRQAMRNRVLESMYSAPLFMEQLVELVEDGEIEDLSPIAWLLAGFRHIPGALENETLIGLVKEISERQNLGVDLMDLYGLVDNPGVAEENKSALQNTLSAFRDVAGGRHDNDHVDFRDISILPTAEEILTDAKPFLPTAASNPKISAQERLFRLLREDCIGRIREEVQCLFSDTGNKYLKNWIISHTFHNVQFRNVSLESRSAIITSFLHPPACRKRIGNKAWKERSRKRDDPVPEFQDFYEKYRKILSRECLVCIVRDGKLLRFALVEQRDPAELGRPFGLVRLRFPRKEDLEDTLQELGNTAKTCMVQLSAPLFAYRPVLRRLKEVDYLSELPFQIGWGSSNATPDSGRCESDYFTSLEASTTRYSTLKSLDDSQRRAMDVALRNPVAVIQGPPGCGKSLVGALIGKVISDVHSSAHILVMAFTNHALDQYVQDLILAGVSERNIVRIGSTQKCDPKIRHLMLGEAKGRLSKVDVMALDTLRGEAARMKENIVNLEQVLRGLNTEFDWEAVCAVLEEENIDYLTSFEAEEDTNGPYKDDWGMPFTSKELWQCWLAGSTLKSLGDVRKGIIDIEGLWDLPKDARKRLAATWRQKARPVVMGNVTRTLATYDETMSCVRLIRKGQDAAVIRGKQIIACTATGASKFLSNFEDLDIHTVIIEEAGELLESHVMAALSRKTKHLVLIGDHKQLRPKISQYELTVESRKGYALNMSLFERLVNDIPFAALDTQHRMRPEISRLVRDLSYPTLKDHASVLARPKVMGLQESVFFVNHNFPEDSFDEIKQRNEEGGASKVNSKEGDLVRRTILYLLLQGYKTQDIVVLTPYLGQMMLLRDGIAKDGLNASIGELDSQDLARSGHSKQPSPLDDGKFSPDQDVLRVATVDNFQGEEAKIIVVSLVRSNEEGHIGFLAEPERVNVLLSRARDGLILFGSSQTFRTASNLRGRGIWINVLKSLPQFPGLPTICEVHGSKSWVASVEDFDKLVPHGGCHLVCGELLSCGIHSCELRCHPGERDHGKLRCRRLVKKSCPQGVHDMELECHQKPPPCDVCDNLCKLKMAEEKRGKEDAAEQRYKDENFAVKLAQLESQIQLERRSLSHESLARERSLKQRQLELEKCYLELERRLRAEQGPLEEERKLELLIAHEEARLGPLKRRKSKEKTVGNTRLPDAGCPPKGQLGPKDRAKKKRSAVGTKLPPAKLAEPPRPAPGPSERQRAARSPTPSDDGDSSPKKTQGEESEDMKEQRPEQASEELSPSTSENEVTPGKDDTEESGGGRFPPSSSSGTDGESDSDESDSDSSLATAASFPLATNKSHGRKKLDTAVFQLMIDKKFAEAVTLFLEHIGEAPKLFRIQEDWFKLFQKRNLKGPGKVKRQMEALQKGQWLSVHEGLEKLKGLDYEVFRLLCRMKMDDETCGQDINSVLMKLMITDTQTPNIVPSMHLLYCIFYLFVWQGDHEVDNEAFRKAAALGVLFLSLLDRATADFQYLESDVKQTLRRISGHLLPQPDESAGALASTSAEKWDWEKSVNCARSGAIDKLMKMTALEPVKEQFLKVYHEAALCKRRGQNLRGKRFGTLVMGNPGTGKTTVSRLWHQLLVEQDAITGDAFVETSGAKLVDGGVEELKKLLGGIYGASGGCLFIDEAYMLDPKKESAGRQVLNFLLAEVENKIGELVVVMAGYKGKMEKLLEHNEGLPSRFPLTLQFPDYTDEELRKIAISNMQEKFQVRRCQVEGGIEGKNMRILIRRLAQGRGKEGFGNARAVQILLDRVYERQALRIASERAAGQLPDDYFFTRDDLLGPKAVFSIEKSEALKKLQGMIGLDDVKASVKALLEVLKTNAELEDQEKPILPVSLNRLFLGAPGTGKTTVAKLYGRILADMGLLSKGDVVVKTPKDFVGSYVGHSEKYTAGILQSTIGKVLVIDEAYGLHCSTNSSGGSGWSDPFRRAVIDTIVAEVQNIPWDDRCVLMLGYEDQMKKMMDEANPGLARRFALKDAFHFKSFSVEELGRILNLRLHERSVEASFKAQIAALQVLEKEKQKANFGNGGSVDNLVSKAILAMSKRLEALPPAERARKQELLGMDFDPLLEKALDKRLDVKEMFSELMGCKDIVHKMEGYKSSALLAKKMGRNITENLSLNFCFVGAPGTGKTTCARKMGELFFQLGVLADKKVIEVSASDLIGQYLGQTAPKTLKKLEEALGSVLFIDEAYRLNPATGGSFASESLDELVDQLTKPRFYKKLVVILAGYTGDIQALMNANGGLASRFSETITFDSFTADQCVSLLKAQLTKADMPYEGDEDALKDWLRKLRAAPNFGNGRDVGTLARKIQREKADSLAKTGISLKKVNPGTKIPLSTPDVVNVISDMVLARTAGTNQRNTSNLPAAQTSWSTPTSAPSTAISASKSGASQGTKPPDLKSLPNPDGVPRDKGVSDQTWAELLLAKQKAKDDEETWNRMEDEVRRRKKLYRELQEKLAQEKEEGRRRELEKQAREAKERARLAEERLRKMEEERRKEEERQRKLRKAGVCVAGYRWLQVSGGYRCAGGSHFVSDDQLLNM